MTGRIPGSPGRCGSGASDRVCEPCHPAKGRPVAVIDHPAGEEASWDWVELPDPPAGWDGYGKRAYLLVGVSSHSSKWRAVLS